MSVRHIAVFGLSLAFAGALAAADWMLVDRAPVPPVASEPPAPQTPMMAVPVAPPPAMPAPVVSAPPPAPVVASLPPSETPPAVSAPPIAATSPATPPKVSAPLPPAAELGPPPLPSPALAYAPPAAAPAVPLPTPMPPRKSAVAETKQPAKLLFASKPLPSLGKAMAIGYYPRGCLQGGVELPPDGPNWQVMRLSRNRNWGHPELVRFLERFAPLAAKATGWKGILVGDMAQPRGGPLPFGHMSHQIGLDVDVWFMPMPGRELSKKEREDIAASNLVAVDGLHVNPETWTPSDIAFIRTAAEQPEVERVLVNAAIKKELCRVEDKKHDSWLAKVRPWYGHADHIHVRLKCPPDSPNCRAQAPVPLGDGCDKSLNFWFKDSILHPKPSKEPAKPGKSLTLADLPPACKTVLDAPANPKAAER